MMPKRSQKRARNLLWQVMKVDLETMDTHEPMDVVEEVPTAVTAPTEEVPEQKTRELKALGVVERYPRKTCNASLCQGLDDTS